MSNSCSTSYLRASLKELLNISAQYNITELAIIKNNECALNVIKEVTKLSQAVSQANIKFVILRDVRTVSSIESRQLILNDFHLLPTGGHAGINRMFNNIKKYYHWGGLYTDVEKFVQRCDACQRYKHSKSQIQPLTLTTTASMAFQKVFLDLVGPLESDLSENKYILTIQCDLSKFIEAYPLPNKETTTVANAFVNNFILRYGIPAEILTDQGCEFMSAVFKETCKILNVKQLNSTAHHHQTLGAIENSHKHLGAYLRMQVAQYKNAWTHWLPFWCFAYNTTVHVETRYTPYELVFGRVAQLPSNISDAIDPLYTFDNYPLELEFRLQQASADARENLIRAKIKRKERYDQCRNSDIIYKRGDLVMVQNIA